MVSATIFAYIRKKERPKPFLFLLVFFVLSEIQIGINGGCSHGYDQDTDQDPEICQERGGDQNYTAKCPNPAAKTMSGVPVCLAIQGPGELDAQSVGLLALGQIVADNQEHQTKYDGHE